MVGFNDACLAQVAVRTACGGIAYANRNRQTSEELPTRVLKLFLEPLRWTLARRRSCPAVVVAKGGEKPMKSAYRLLGLDGQFFDSQIPGTVGGHRRLKIYGRLDCPSALRHIALGHYVQHRVFFLDEASAIAAGFRPCSRCMPEAYYEWKQQHDYRPG